METINKEDLISLLKNSRLVGKFDEEKIVHKKYVLNVINITDNNTFNKTMDMLRFYMVVLLSYEIYDYIAKNNPDLSNFKDFFFEELTLLKETKKKY